MVPLKYWLFLACSILLEVAGTSLMKASQASHPVTGLLLMYALLGLSYYFLARAVVRLPIGVAYAFWEGFGLILIVLVSFLCLGEAMTMTRLLALALVLLGSLLVHHGTQAPETEKPAPEARPEDERTRAPHGRLQGSM